MTRPLRLEFPGALYHVTTRGDRRKTIFTDDIDRGYWLEVLELVCKRFNFVVHAYCQMGNHYHLMVETIEGNLAQGMRQLNSLYSQKFNRRHKFVGHVFQGRYKGILVHKESYLLELSRYVVLNPVRGCLVNAPGDWRWSSYNATLGHCTAPEWLEVDWILSQFGSDREGARQSYVRFVLAGVGKSSPLRETQHQIILGDATFVEQHSRYVGCDTNLTAITKDQRRLGAKKLIEYEANCSERDEAMFRAYSSTAFTMVEIAAHFGVSAQTVSRAVQRYERLSMDVPQAGRVSR
jgi:putative transposase